MTASRHPWASWFAVLSMLTAVMAAEASAADWPGWRGPTRDGVAAAGETMPLTWSDDNNLIWQAAVPGRCHGSPCVSGNAIYLATCDEGDGSQSVLAFDRSSGSLLWQQQVHAAGGMRKNERSTAASCTLACDGQAVYVAFPNADRLVATAITIDVPHPGKPPSGTM